jgi:hypothetical protein
MNDARKIMTHTKASRTYTHHGYQVQTGVWLKNIYTAGDVLVLLIDSFVQ